MFKFQREQRILEIGGVRIGGQPGELPTVLIGSLFHVGHKIVKDRKTGAFDRRRAEDLIRVEEEMSEKTGVPCMLDVVGDNAESLIRYVDFVSDMTDMPFLVNGPEMSTRIVAIEHAIKSGLGDRAIYTSMNYTIKDTEIQAIKRTGVKAAIIQSFGPRNLRPEGMVSMLKELLQAASGAAIEKPLLLISVLDVPSISVSARGVHVAKQEFGLPTGTAPMGVVGQWSRVQELGEHAKESCRTSAAALAQAMGANFLIYGSVAKAREVFPACAMVDATIAYNARDFGVKPLTKDHPLYKIF